MSPIELKNSILRLINYKGGSNRERFEKSVRYVTNPQKTDDKLVLSSYIDRGNPMNSLDLIEKRWHNEDMDGRLFKHGIISFGSPDMDPEKALELVKATMEYYQDFPYLAALHTDVPRRLHAHFLLVMRNVKTGKKFSQSKAELKDFRSHYHKLALRFNLLGLKDLQDNSISSQDVLAATLTQKNTMPKAAPLASWSEPSFSASIPIYNNPQPVYAVHNQPEFTRNQPVSLQNDITVNTKSDLVNGIFKTVQADFNYFFYQGFKGGLYNE